MGIMERFVGGLADFLSGETLKRKGRTKREAKTKEKQRKDEIKMRMEHATVIYNEIRKDAASGNEVSANIVRLINRYRDIGYPLDDAISKSISVTEKYFDKHKKITELRPYVKCPDCTKTFQSMKDYENHWRKTHSLKEAYKKVVHKGAPKFVPSSIKGGIPTSLTNFMQRSLETAEKAVPAMAGGTKRSIKKAPGAIKRTFVKGTGRHPVICERCGTVYDYELKHCPNPPDGCGLPNPYQEETYIQEQRIATKKLRYVTGKKVGYKIYTVFMVEIAGILSLFIPQYLGFPIAFNYLAIALMAFVPAYILLPGERDVLRSIGPDQPFDSGKAALLFPKAGAKIFAFAFILLQFSMINMVLTLILAFIFYLPMPSAYRVSQPYKIIEAWAKMLLGAYIAFLFWFVFRAGGLFNNVNLALALMAAAFFVNFPRSKSAQEAGRITVEIGKISKLQDSPIGYALFIVLMIASLFFTMTGTAWTWTMSQMMFVAVWFLSFVTGLSTGPEGRPGIGVLMIFIAMFTFSSIYTGYVGQAVFGYWWPYVLSFGETYLAPLSTAWSQAQFGLGDVWLLITNPQQYYLIQLQQQQAGASIVDEGGSPLSIELTRFELFPSLPGVLEPTEPMTGTIELTNQGEFESDYLELEVWTSWQDPVTLGEEVLIGDFARMTCSGRSDAIESDHVATCEWDGTIYPNEVKLSTFIYEDYGWVNSGVDLRTEEYVYDEYGNITAILYDYSGHMIRVRVNTTYDYKVNVSLPIEVIDTPTYITLLENRQVVLHELYSRYTGGPVKATLYIPRQPIRDTEPSIVIASILNEGTGNIEDVTFTVLVPIELGTPTTIRTSFDPGCGAIGSRSIDGKTYNAIVCEHSETLVENREFKRISFFIEPRDVSSVIERQTNLIIGLADYTYVKTSTQILQVANAPPQ